MRLVFQDLDGVFNCNATYRAMKHNPDRKNPIYHLEERLVTRVDEALRECGVDSVVLSTTWREDHSQEAVTKYLRDKGFTLPIIGVTPRIPQPPEWRGFTYDFNRRGMEIQGWLEANFPNETWRDLHIAIIDDKADMGVLSRWHVHTKEASGYLPENTRRLRKVLEKPLGDQVKWRFDLSTMVVFTDPFIGDPK